MSRPLLLDCTTGLPDQEVRTLQRRWAEYLELPLVRTLDLDGVPLELVFIPPGRFLMGSPRTELECGEDETLHPVELARPFYLGKLPITQQQWARVMRGDNPSSFWDGGECSNLVRGLETKKFPVDSVSWKQASAFCKRLAKFGRRRFCLPTEAQWEFACRAGTCTPFHFGTALDGGDANCAGHKPYGMTEPGEFLGRTCEVGQYAANALGLYDMHGNVWEWCADWYGPYSKSKQRDPTGPAEGTSHVRRGGAWDTRARDCRAASRGRSAEAGLTRRSREEPSQRVRTVVRGGNVGLRLAMLVD